MTLSNMQNYTILALAVAWVRVKRAHDQPDNAVSLSSQDTKSLTRYGDILNKLGIRHVNLTQNLCYGLSLNNVVGLCRALAGLQNKDMSVRIAKRLGHLVTKHRYLFKKRDDFFKSCGNLTSTYIVCLANDDARVRNACTEVCNRVLLSYSEHFYCKGLSNLLYILEVSLQLCGFDIEYIKGDSAVWETFHEVSMALETDASRPKIQLDNLVGDDLDIAKMFVGELVKQIGFILAMRTPLRTEAIGIKKRRILSVLLATRNPALKQFYKIDWSSIS